MSGLKVPKRHHQQKTPSHRHAPKQEKKLAQKLGGEVVRGSGCGPAEKGDVRIRGIMRIENKCTKRKSFSVTREIVEKIEDAALSAGEVPAVQVDFLSDSGAKEAGLVVMPEWALEMIVGALRDATEKPDSDGR